MYRCKIVFTMVHNSHALVCAQLHLDPVIALDGLDMLVIETPSELGQSLVPALYLTITAW